MDKRPLLAQSAPRSVTLSPRTDWGVNAAACASTSSLAGRVLHTHVLIKYFLSIKPTILLSACAGASDARQRRQRNTPHRPPVGLACGVLKKSNEY